MKRLALLASVGLLTSCSLPVMFSVAVDEPVLRGKLTLNGNSADLVKNFDGAYWAKWNGSDAAGTIDVVFPDGAVVTCRVGYVTQGMGVQAFSIHDRHCEREK